MKERYFLSVILVALSCFSGAQAHDLLARNAGPAQNRLQFMLPAQRSAVAPVSCPLETVAPAFAAVPVSYSRKFNTSGHRFLDSEVGAGDVTPQMYAVLDDLIMEGQQRLKPIPAVATPAQQKQFARDALVTIDCILLRHRFVYPGHGLVQLLSDGLGPTRYSDAADIKELSNQRHNVRRSRFISGAGDYYVVDCDTASYIYLALGRVDKGDSQ